MASATISITINTPAGMTVANLVDVLSSYWSYQAKLPDGTDNPVSKTDFIKSKVAGFVKESYVAAKANADAETARKAAVTSADSVTVV